MRLLLVTSEPAWIEALRACLSPADAVLASDVGQITQNPALVAACDGCLVAESSPSPWTVETLKQIGAVTEVPLFVLADTVRSSWEEAALFAGAQQVFRKPLRGDLIQLTISRCQRVRSAPPSPPPPPATRLPGVEPGPRLVAWRDFARMLEHVDEPARLLEAWIRSMRDALRCGRLILYVAETAGAERTFRCAGAAGIPAQDFEAFRLNQRSGVASLVAERGAVIGHRQLRPDIGRELAAAREMRALGAELAVPVTGRRGLVALLLVGARVAGGEYSEDEIALLYQAAEGLAPLVEPKSRGAADDPAAAGQESALLQAMPMPGAIVTQSLRIADVNAAFRALLGRTEACAVAFDELPAKWGEAISAAVQSQAESARVEVEHRALGTPRKVRLAVRRVSAGPNASAPCFLVTVEEAASPATLAQESGAHAMHALLQRAGEQLSNEFRNALTPVDIMVQLSRERSTSRAELERLGSQVGLAIHRLRRRIDDLAYLTKNAIIPEPTSVSALMRLTRERLDDWLEGRHLKRIIWLNEFAETPLLADARALALAVAELVMNAIEASDGQQVTVTADVSPEVVSIRIRNSGVWAPPPESSGFRHRPFVSSKSTGVGLGIEVASRVAENHGGKLAIGPISADTVEAILRIPCRVLATTAVETRVEQAF